MSTWCYYLLSIAYNIFYFCCFAVPCCCFCSVAQSSLTVTPWSVAHQAPYSSQTLGVGSDSCPSNQWCHATISSSAASFSFSLQSFPTSGSLPMSQLFPTGGQKFGASTSASDIPMNIQRWFPSGMTGLISFLSRGLSRVFSSTTVKQHQFFSTQHSLRSCAPIHTGPLGKTWLWLDTPLLLMWCLCFLLCDLHLS